MDALAQAARGVVIGPYVLHQKFAGGPMAEVYLATRASAGETVVVIKRLQRELLLDPVFVSAIVREGRRSRGIADRHVLRTLDVLLLEGRELLFVSEHVPGETLANVAGACFRRRVRVPVEIAVAIVGGILRGLTAAHEWRDGQGQALPIVHGGLSPQNVLVGVDGVARVMDFGLAAARAAAPASAIRYASGKSSYLAPEQILRQPVDARADVYAAAVILWELLTGERLFRDTGAVAIARQITSHRVPPPSEVQPELPAVLDALVLRALERPPANRFATAADFADALEGTIAPSSADDVGAWIAGLLRERLDDQALLKREITNGTGATTVETDRVDGAESDDAFDVADTQVNEAESSREDDDRDDGDADRKGPWPAATAPWLSLPAGWAGAPRGQRGGAGDRKGRRRGEARTWRQPSRLVAAALLLAAGVWLLRVRGVGHPPAPVASARAPAAAPPARQTPAPATATGPQDPAARAGGPDALGYVVQPPLGYVVQPPAASTNARGAVARPRARTTPRTASAVDPCDPPYTIDARGIRRVKRNCLDAGAGTRRGPPEVRQP